MQKPLKDLLKALAPFILEESVQAQRSDLLKSLKEEWKVFQEALTQSNSGTQPLFKAPTGSHWCTALSQTLTHLANSPLAEHKGIQGVSATADRLRKLAALLDQMSGQGQSPKSVSLYFLTADGKKRVR